MARLHLHVQYLTLLSLHTITVLPLSTVYIVIEVHCLRMYYTVLYQYYAITNKCACGLTQSKLLAHAFMYIKAILMDFLTINCIHSPNLYNETFLLTM